MLEMPADKTLTTVVHKTAFIQHCMFLRSINYC